VKRRDAASAAAARSDAAVRRPGPRAAGYALLALFFALADLRLIVLLMPKAFLLSADVAAGVVRGEPLWRVYQSRVLGPYLVHALSASTYTGVAYAWFFVLAMFAAGFGVLGLTDHLRDPRRPPVGTFLMFQALFLFLLPGIWIYAWDLLSLLFFIVFDYLVLRRAQRAWFAVLYAIAVFNHEIAFFIAGWLVLDPIVRYVAGRGRGEGRARFDWATGALGLGLLTGGVALVEGLRRVLLLREVQPPQELPQFVTYGRSFHLALAQNWNTFTHCFTLNVPDGFPLLVPVFLLAVVLLAAWLARSDWPRFGALSVVHVGMVVSYVLFGLVFETRLLMPLIPFVAMNGWAVFMKEGRQGA
jgi:hypothetical protein